MISVTGCTQPSIEKQTNFSIRLYPMRNEGSISIFFSELIEKHGVTNAVFLVDLAPWLKAILNRHSLRYEIPRNRNVTEHISE